MELSGQRVRARFAQGAFSKNLTRRAGETIGYGRDDTLIRKGTQRSNGQKVCFKVIPTRNEQRRSDALREAEMLAAAKHKHVLEFISCFQSRSEVAIVTELCASDMLDRVRYMTI